MADQRPRIPRPRSITDRLDLLRSEVRLEFAELRTELREGLAKVRTEIADFRGEFREFRGQVKGIGVALVAIVPVATVLLSVGVNYLLLHK
jgi:hypothetical protein